MTIYTLLLSDMHIISTCAFVCVVAFTLLCASVAFKFVVVFAFVLGIAETHTCVRQFPPTTLSLERWLYPYIDICK